MHNEPSARSKGADWPTQSVTRPASSAGVRHRLIDRRVGAAYPRRVLLAQVKTVLLNSAAEAGVAAGARVLRAEGVEFVADLAFSGLNQALMPLAGGFED